MKVDQVVIVFHTKGRNHFADAFPDGEYFIDVGVGFDHRKKNFLGEVVHLAAGELFFQATDDRGGKNDVTDGTETYDQDLLHGLVLSKVKNIAITFASEIHC